MAAPTHRGRLSSMDASFLYLERKEAPMHIGAVGILAGKVPFEEYARSIAAKLHRLPRFREKVVATPFFVGHPTWESDPDFDIHHHLTLHHLSQPGGEGELKALADEIIAERLDRGRPLWELHVIHGLAGGNSAIVSKVHHAMVDGVGGNEIMTTIFDLAPESPAPGAAGEYQESQPAGARERMVEALWDNARTAMDSLAEYQRAFFDSLRDFGPDDARASLEVLRATLPNLALPPRRLPFNRPCSGKRHFTWTTFSFAEARAVRSALAGTVNDVILACLAGAVGRYCLRHGVDTKGRLMRVMVPVNVRPEDRKGELGNLVSVLPVDVPLDVSDAAHRVGLIREATRVLKRGRVADRISMMSHLLGVVPVPMQAAFGAMAVAPFPPFNLVCTNVPGPQIPLYALGRPLLAYYPYVPLGFDMGVGCAIFSYNQTLHIGLNSDTHACPDVELLREDLDAAIAEVKAAASVSTIEKVDTSRRAAAPSRSAAPADQAAAGAEGQPDTPPFAKPRRGSAKPKGASATAN